MSLNTVFLALVVEYVLLNLIPRPRPAFRRLQYGKAVFPLCMGRAWKRGFVLLPLYTRWYIHVWKQRYKRQLKYLCHYYRLVVQNTTEVPTLLGFQLCLLASIKVFRNFSYVPGLESSRVACNREHTVMYIKHLGSNLLAIHVHERHNISGYRK